MNIDFEDFMRDPRETVVRVLEFAEIDVDTRARTALDTMLLRNTRDRYGRFDYRFSVFDLDEDQIRERFSNYTRNVSSSPQHGRHVSHC